MYPLHSSVLIGFLVGLLVWDTYIVQAKPQRSTDIVSLENDQIWAPSDNAVDDAPVWETVDEMQQLKPKRSPTEQDKKVPPRCLWAIISCCTASSNALNYDCFEQLGCYGVFWDNNPCDSDFANAAISSAMKYYEKR
ncbi:uncharacterized protein LOC116167348 [Photinus pyralis]|uniref:Secreted protein n=1 Tax=Photinus pyralis TaxID=7054 RepID=A0A1Y1LPV7_PHOPY|nr:uncharacterized protein LOC116167348 [Photinus pyralis]